jgi:hypothetical protein
MRASSIWFSSRLLYSKKVASGALFSYDNHVEETTERNERYVYWKRCIFPYFILIARFLFSRQTASVFSQIYWLFWRQLRVNIKDLNVLRQLFVQTTVIGLFFGLIYLKTNKDEKSAQNLNGLIFIMLIQVSYCDMISVINVSIRSEIVTTRLSPLRT